MRRSFAAATLLLLVLTLTATSCDGDSTSQPDIALVGTEAPASLLGRVQLDQPITQGQVTLWVQGTPTRNSPLTTHGNFQFSDVVLPPQSAVVVETEIDGSPAHLAAEIEPTGATNHYFLNVNTVTTLVAGYRKKHPELTFEQAEKDVLLELGILGRVNYKHGLEHPHSGFSETLFLELARDSGGYDAFVEEVLQDIDNPQQARAKSLDPGLFSTSGLKSLGGGLASNLGGYLAKEAFGWGLAAIGVPTSQHVIVTQLDAIQAQLDAISSQLDSLFQQVLALADTVLTSSIATPLAEIPDYTRQYSLALGGAYTDSQIADLVNRILDRSSWIASIDQAQRGINGGQGLMQLSLGKVAPTLTDNDDQQTLATQAVYYQTFQMNAANLLVEACHTVSPLRPFDAESYLDALFVSQKRQNAFLKLSSLTTPSEFFPVQSPFIDTIAIWPPVGSFAQFAKKQLDSPYPTVPNDLLYDTANLRVWNYHAQGPLSLTGIEAFAQNDTYHGYHWRLPTLNEIRAMRRSIDANKLAKFNVDGTGSSTGYSNYLWTADSEVYNAIQGNDVRSQKIYDFLSDDDAAVGPIFTGEFANGPEEPNDRNGDPVLMPALLVADFNKNDFTPELSVSVMADDHGAQCSANLVYTVTAPNGNSVKKTLDVTDRVVWSVLINGASDSANLRAHIDNSPDSSGRLAFRQGIRTSDQVQVSAEFGSLKVTQNVATLAADTTPTALLLSPNRIHVDGNYPASQRLTVTLVTADGYFNSSVGTSLVSFSSNDSSVTVTPGGTVTATETAVSKAVEVTATYNDGVHPPVTGSMALILEPQ